MAETPKFSGKWLGILANRWSISGILTLSSGAFLTATTGFDRALTGIGSQRPDQVLDDLYGDKSFTKYLNPAAFALPSPGTNGNLGVATILGPGFWNLDTAVSRVIRIRENQNVEFRAEAFNLTNSVRKGNPNVNLSSAVFGRITTALAPRIMQFALRYAF